MFNSELMLQARSEGKYRGFAFKAAKSVVNANLLTPVGACTVYVNGERTDMSPTSITFNEGDIVEIDAEECDPEASFPIEEEGVSTRKAEESGSEEPEPPELYDRDYFYEIYSPLPKGFTYFDSLFLDCMSLTSIPANLFANNPNAISFYGCFEGCSSLTSIPEDLFANNPNVTDFSNCFHSCNSLTSIPEKLFANNHNVTDFEGCFNRCSSLTSIPENLFANNPNVTDFRVCFLYCTRLSSIPEKLFANNPNVTGFGGCFEGCSSLTSIPEKLFANNPKVTGFSNCFSICSGLTSIPEKLFANNPNVTDFGSCFRNCSKLGSIELNIASGSVDDAWLFFRGSGSGTVILHVPAGSETEKEFKSYGYTVVPF